MKTNGVFAQCSRWSSYAMGHPVAFGLALTVILAWAVTGPIFNFSDTWQLVINTGTTIVTFLMVFLIQNTQNHQGDAIQLKLDELIRAVNGAHNLLVDLEDASEEEVAEIKARYRRLRDEARQEIERGMADTGSPEILEGQSCEPAGAADRAAPGRSESPHGRGERDVRRRGSAGGS